MSEDNAVTIEFRPSAEAIAIAEWASIRTRRSQLLVAADSLQGADSPLTEAQSSELATYRQALRDIPQDVGDPFTITWPEAPAFLK
ncbi:hypothetical protein PF66_00469 [Pseudomonas asplenii]|uniref:Phage tail assembly chaperone-like domain-containing protein n=1 Tax=Pseudomonas asplenii TaxID=53407 RepID=A0A0M9GJC7_9PSED|nr:tail fiber assembly protein [Pseudomonas fuscovaginae]KPA92731.1 hypothetical protein PF66_00469 [Pseudomonas fuscovaginae]